MNQRTRLVAGSTLVACLLATSVAAVYYRYRMTVLRELHAAEEQELSTLRAQTRDASVPEPGAGPINAAPATADANGGGTDELLREQIRELEVRVRAKDEVVASLRQQLTNAPPQRAERPRDRRAWLEDMKQNDPQGYEEFLQQREERRQRLKDTLARKSAFFLGRDTSALTEDEQEQYSYMLNLLDETWQASETSQDDNLPWEERRQARHTVFRNARELAPMLEAEREVELYNLGRSVGYSEDEADEFTAYVQELIELTTMNSMFENMFRGRGGGGSPSAQDRP